MTCHHCNDGLEISRSLFLAERNAELTAERDRYREALDQIESASDDVDELHMKIIARAALAPSTKETPSWKADRAELDKQEAQRRVFQLRRRAINSAPKAEPVNKATGPSLTAQERAREFISEHYGYGPPQETVEDLALVLEQFSADSVSAAEQVWAEQHA